MTRRAPAAPYGHAPMSILPVLAALPATLPTTGPTTAPLAVTADTVLSPYIYVFYAAFGVSFVFTPVMRMVALYYHVIDAPDAKRKLHAAPIAYLGGVAIFLGWLAGLAISQGTGIHRPDTALPHLHLPAMVLLAAVMIVALGLADDLVKVSPRVKIVVQVLAAGVLLWGGVGLHSVEPLLGPVLLRMQIYLGWGPAWLHSAITLASGALTIALVVGCCNATNLMDGMDGLCGGVSAIVAIGFTFLAVHMAGFGTAATTNADGLRVVLGLALLGGVLGFLLFNFNPASIFMGDTGSMFIGFSCATLMASMAENEPRWFLAALVMFALPILDTALAFARRFVNGRPLFSADRQHIHHQIAGRGHGVKQTVLIMYAMTVAFVVLGAAIVFIRVRYAAAVYLVVFASILVAAFKAGLVHETVAVDRTSGLGDAGAGEAIGGVADGDGVLTVPDPAPPTAGRESAPVDPPGVYRQS